ncbi:MAG: high-affinity branched-chain amino acid ABC transporter ATP-binding protein LivG [Deltaproteobacteria bacterium CG11_big_fil_rev_8_21_14_0_20_47_16]|nr:MAG: high-affinity branched-chain amino acid ABC transporter ATP-binding protein LivG [Deltaproteobacteria bacterium CG11_big_fil_rev_8_21_14_0_20_47_16]
MALLSIRDCTIQFGGLTALNQFTCRMRSGELLGVIGPNGAGKTTLFNVLTGIYAPTSGAVEFENTSLAQLKPHQINRLGIARTFQNIRLFGDLTVEDNVLLAMHRSIQTNLFAISLGSRRYAREANLAHRRARQLLSEFRLDAFANRPSKSLPYGDQRKVEIIRAMATQPRLLLLDEPAAGMNATEKRELMTFIRHINKDYGLAIVLIEHDMHVVMNLCPRIIVLDHGQQIAEGPPEAVRRNPKVIEAYLGVQPTP